MRLSLSRASIAREGGMGRDMVRTAERRKPSQNEAFCECPQVTATNPTHS